MEAGVDEELAAEAKLGRRAGRAEQTKRAGRALHDSIKLLSEGLT